MTSVDDSLDQASVGPLAQGKEDRLREILREMQTVLVAFSGGVDSTYLAYIANSELGVDALCVTGESPSLSSHQREETKRIVSEFGLNAIAIETHEIDNPDYTANDPSRCYFCKDELFSVLTALAAERKLNFVVDGSTTDDLSDYRPGRKAAREQNIRSPLIEANMSKAEVRVLSRRAGLPTWDRPASPCLSSRIAYGTPVTIERLATVDRGEEVLRSLGFREFRVRHHDNLVRLEIAPAEMDRALDRKVVDELAARFRELGFKFVTLDLMGFRSGSLNEILKAPGASRSEGERSD